MSEARVEFQRLTGVSRETLARLDQFAALLHRWQGTVNLVSAASLPDLWRRHMLDSAQLVALIPPGTRRIVDLGSGAGFPGIVLAILNAAPEVHLVESDQRKATFLREAARVTGAAVEIHANRAESLDLPQADVATARALAPLERLVELAAPLVRHGGIGLFPKGRDAEAELTRVTRRWHIDARRHPSLTDPSGVILQIGFPVDERSERSDSPARPDRRRSAGPDHRRGEPEGRGGEDDDDD